MTTVVFIFQGHDRRNCRFWTSHIHFGAKQRAKITPISVVIVTKQYKTSILRCDMFKSLSCVQQKMEVGSRGMVSPSKSGKWGDCQDDRGGLCNKNTVTTGMEFVFVSSFDSWQPSSQEANSTRVLFQPVKHAA